MVRRRNVKVAPCDGLIQVAAIIHTFQRKIGTKTMANLSDSANSQQSDETRSSWRIFLKVALVGVAVLILAAICLQFFVADQTPFLTLDLLEEAQRRWESNKVASYDMDIEVRGAQPGRVHVEVRDTQVSAETRDGRTPPQHTWYVWSVPGLFEMLDQELVLAEDPEKNMNAAPGTKLQLRCEFDLKFGYPKRYHRFSTGDAPEVDWTVTKFQVK